MAKQAETIFVTGYARLPAGITAGELYRVVGVGLEVEVASGRIVAAECTLATQLGRDFVRRILVGRSLEGDLPAVFQEIERRYQGYAQKAIITALKTIQDKYRSLRERERGGEGTAS